MQQRSGLISKHFRLTLYLTAADSFSYNLKYKFILCCKRFLRAQIFFLIFNNTEVYYFHHFSKTKFNVQALFWLITHKLRCACALHSIVLFNLIWFLACVSATRILSQHEPRASKSKRLITVSCKVSKSKYHSKSHMTLPVAHLRTCMQLMSCACEEFAYLSFLLLALNYETNRWLRQQLEDHKNTK